MRRNALCFINFAVGAAVGFVVGCKMLRKKYELIVQEEIESVRNAYKNKHQTCDDNSNTVVEEDESYHDEILEEYKELTEKYGSSNISTTKEKTNAYVISPEEFGDGDNKLVSLTYYADEVLADDSGYIIIDVNDTVGKDSLKTFGEYLDDCVYVRNDNLQTDYEILLDERNYEEVYPDRR